MKTYSLADLPGVPQRFDRLFFHTVRMSRFAPDVHFAVNHEIEEPFRRGRCLVLHLEPFRTGLVIGWYPRNGLTENAALQGAMRLRRPTQEELDDFDEDVTQRFGQRPGIRTGATAGGAVRPGGHGRGVGPAGGAGTE